MTVLRHRTLSGDSLIDPASPDKGGATLRAADCPKNSGAKPVPEQLDFSGSNHEVWSAYQARNRFLLFPLHNAAGDRLSASSWPASKH